MNREPLFPADEDQTRPASLADIVTLITRSANPRFVAQCQAFKDNFRQGDEIFEYCTCKDSWNHRTGRMGFRLLRKGVLISDVVTLTN